MYRFQLIAYLVGVKVHHARGGTRDEQTLTKLYLSGFDGQLCHAKVREILHHLAHQDLFLGSLVAIFFGPFAQLLTLVIAVPESSVEDSGQAFVPSIFLLFSESTFNNRLNGFFVARHHVVHILWSACPALDFEHPNARIHHEVNEANGLQILRTHDIFVVYLQLVARLVVGNGVRTAADLHAFTTVGRAVSVVKTHVTFAADCHAKRTMTEHLNANEFATGAADVLFDNLLVNLFHLF